MKEKLSQARTKITKSFMKGLSAFDFAIEERKLVSRMLVIWAMVFVTMVFFFIKDVVFRIVEKIDTVDQFAADIATTTLGLLGASFALVSIAIGMYLKMRGKHRGESE